ncbi:MAG: Rieske 2Fe-2S domain-containing protein [Agriterribacter sp.]
MMEKQYQWHKIAEHINELDFSENNIAVAEVNGKKLCIGKFNNLLFGFAYKCPHAGGFLSEGYIDAIGNVVCPIHRYKFNMANGRNITGEGYFLKTWPVKTEDESIFIGM